MLNEGLEILGCSENDDEKEIRGMTFAGSGIESIQIPSTLKMIETATFLGAKI